MTNQPTLTDETIDAARGAVLEAIPTGLSHGAAEHIGLGVIDAVGPHIAAQALRTYANQQHPHAVGHARQVDYGTGIEYDTECGGCGSSWSETEGGCTERVELLRAANALVAPPGPDCNCHETGAPCNCAD